MIKWFTPERRQKIQVAAASLVPLLLLAGFGTQGVWDQWLIILGALLQAVSSALSLANVRDPRTWLVVLRGTIYLLAATVSPALVLLGFYDEAANAAFLAGLSVALSSLSNVLSVFIGKGQELAAVTAAVGLVKGPDGTFRLPSGEVVPMPGDRRDPKEG